MTANTMEITCPHCNHVMTDDEMYNDPTDLYAIAPHEAEAEVECPSCDSYFIVQGSYIPQYETRKPDEDE